VNQFEHVRPWNETYNYRKMTTEPVGSPASSATVAWRGGTDGGHDVTVYAMSWRNPYPEKIVTFVDVLASAYRETNGNRLCVLALTGREPDSVDLRIAKSRHSRTVMRRYRPRPAVPEGAVLLDLTRGTLCPQLAIFNAADTRKWQTVDRWVTAQAAAAYGLPGNPSCGVYSALHPNDHAWRGHGDLLIRFKRLVSLRAIGVKGAMQTMAEAKRTPIDFELQILGEDLVTWQSVGAVTGHIGEEGEERWVFDKEKEIAAVRVRLSKGPGISSISLYGRPLGPVSVKSSMPLSPGKMFDKETEITDEDVLDALDGI